MEVVLLQDVDKIGLRGEVVNVARGYARNFLLPRRLAEPATSARVAEIRKVEERRSRHEAKTFEDAQKVAELLSRAELRFEMKAGPTGSLFGSVTATNVADELWAKHKVRVDRRKIDLESIKRIGRYSVPVELFQDVTIELRTLVVPEGGELPPDEELEAMAAAELAEQKAAAEPPESAVAEAREAEQEVVEPTPLDAAQERPDDEFDRAAGAALETPGEHL